MQVVTFVLGQSAFGQDLSKRAHSRGLHKTRVRTACLKETKAALKLLEAWSSESEGEQEDSTQKRRIEIEVDTAVQLGTLYLRVEGGAR